MKMKNKNKGKIHPSPPSSNSLSILSLLPSTILTLISILSLEDKQALAYMLTRTKKKTKHSKNTTTPVFDCDCFECYTSYWHQWDTSPNREIIHLAIEAFEERDEEISQKRRGNKRRERPSSVNHPLLHDISAEKNKKSVEVEDTAVVVTGDDDGAVPARRVLPEVVGMIGSRLWSFWSPGIINNNSD